MISLLMAIDLDWGGPLVSVHWEVMKRLSPGKFSVSVFCSKRDHEVPRIPNVHLLHLSEPPLSLLRLKSWLTKSLAKHFDVLHSVPIFAIPSLLPMPTKKIASFHGLPGDFGGARIPYLYGKVLARTADRSHTVSEYSREVIRQHYGIDCHVIYNGVDTKVFRPVSHENPRPQVLYVGRFVSWKRPHWAARLAKLFPKCDFVIHGKGPYAKALQEISHSTPNLTIDTSDWSKAELARRYALSDIFLYPATDWFSLVTLEAMSSGLPVLLHSEGGQAELIEDGREGLIAGSFEDFRRKLSYLIDSESVRSEMGLAARRAALSYDWSKIAMEYERLYQEVVNID